MANPKLTSDQIAEVVDLVAEYISGQCQKFATHALRMSDQQRDAVSAFFPADLLENTRLLVLQAERVSNPQFYSMLRGLGFANLPDQSGMAAITFCNVVVSHEPFSNGLLFHELVHVEQYRQLGIRLFAQLYVRGFLNSGSYEAIPLEVNAYTLEDRFRREPHRSFSVQQEVAKWAAEGRF